MFRIYGYWEVEHHDCPYMDYYISEEECPIHYLISEHTTREEAEEALRKLFKEE